MPEMITAWEAIDRVMTKAEEAGGWGKMTDISLPYDQVCEIIQDVAADWACDPEELAAMTKKFTLNEWLGLFARYGHTLLRALEEAHLARQGKGKSDD